MNPSFNRRFRVGASLLLAAVVAGACDRSDLSERMDPGQRILFQLPQGWQTIQGSSETRFHPPGNPRIQVQINTTDAVSGGTLAQQRDAWLDFQTRSGADILVNEDGSTEHFEGVAYAHTTETPTGAKIWHHVLLNGGDFTVATYLQAPPDQYESALPVYRDILSSIRPAQE